MSKYMSENDRNERNLKYITMKPTMTVALVRVFGIVSALEG